ncbi:major facilitator superfamily domain-containing protein [Lineolata rhizophorae]|uniref:Major facilitator superfamily domain-containing protein n=1 Tax=Lineolata rhizophorae TaxID=578093 RepID=A0A6A6NT53_9PEZI|nr:major facilitator superfamily domain-containing protein [Lineolata rhizophorae]
MVERVNTKTDPEGAGDVYIVKEEVDNSAEAGTGAHSQLKHAKDGKTVLIPQPSDDQNDPLNWSWIKKHCVFLALLPGCFLTDWVITWGSTLFEAQAMDWHMSVPDVANSISGAIFMQGPGGLLAVPLVQRYGRLPVLFWSQFLTLVCSIGATYASGYAGFTACRTLQGFFGAPPQVIGLSIVHDMFFFHERARKVNIWAFSFLLGPYLGPFVSGFIIQELDWRNTFGVLCGFYGFSVLLIILLGDETLYNRNLEKQPTRRGGIIGRVMLLTGVTGVMESEGKPGVWEVTVDLFSVFVRPYLLLPTLGFVTWITMWTIGLVSTITQFVKPPPYLFSNTAVALLYFAPMIGTLLAEFWGHWFNDFLCNRYIRTHGGTYRPESRLWGIYPSWIIGIIGLVVFGETLQHQVSWVGIAFGWAMNCFSTLGCMVVISAYVLDVFPQHAALAAAWMNAMRTVGGFCVVYFQLDWVHHNGPAIAFGCQAAIVAFFIVSIIAVQLKGRQWRARFPPPVGSRST